MRFPAATSREAPRPLWGLARGPAMRLSALPRPCPRCSGHLIHADDAYGGYSSCLRCGFVHEWVSGPAVKLPADPTPGSRQRRREPSHGRQLL